ncbi:MAG: plasmid pRiA4b ORF-3 family protein [Chloroflexi bacterium]|nr:plasmid pRiA4b ORF-3 family protein [Chloroflexota bacterium]
MYRVNFITTEKGDDLIVSFTIAAGDFPGDILSLTLLRTPKFEFILDRNERGVSVFWEEDEDESELLLAVERSKDIVKLTNSLIIIADPGHEEYLDMMTWLGGHFDPLRLTSKW